MLFRQLCGSVLVLNTHYCTCYTVVHTVRYKTCCSYYILYMYAGHASHLSSPGVTAVEEHSVVALALSSNSWQKSSRTETCCSKRRVGVGNIMKECIKMETR